MKRCYPPLWLAASALLVLLLPAARATTVIAPTFDRMVASSDYIVRATVKSVVSDWRQNPDKPGERYIGSMVELNVLEVIKGTPPSPLVLDLVGGRVGDKELTIEGMPKFVVGEETILFVKGNGRQIIPLVGMMHGKYNVRHNKLTGRDEVFRHNGDPLYNEQDISRAASTDGAPSSQQTKAANPLTASDFATRIRNSAKSSNRESSK
ncbi:MAG TPA: hypothetical protein VIM71_13815 [Lacunisphaera sp.]